MKAGSCVLQNGLMVLHYPFPVCRSPMKGGTTVSSATVLVLGFPNLFSLLSVSIMIHYELIANGKKAHACFASSTYILLHLADPPRITRDLQNLKDALCGKPVTFTAEATGTEPLNYQWEWKQPVDNDEWQPCDGEAFTGADSSRLTIPSVQK